MCGSNENSTDKKKKKFKFRQQDILNNPSLNNKIINRTEPTPICSYRPHCVNVTSLNHTIQQQNSPNKSFHCKNLTNKYSNESSLNSFTDQNFSTSILNNDFTIKNIVLHRNSPNERLGLTLCYGLTTNSTTNIYIQQVDKESIAGQLNQLRSGDQIIKINNHRVTSRDEAINLVNDACHIVLQIIRFQSPKVDFPIIQSNALTEDDSGVILGCTTDFETTNDLKQPKILNKSNRLYKSCISLSTSSTLHNCSSCRRIEHYSNQYKFRRCLSLTDFRSCSSLDEKSEPQVALIRSQSLFGTTTDNEQIILKPLPYNNNLCQERNLIEGKTHRDDSDSGLVCGRSRSNDSYHIQYNQCRWTLKHFRRRCREQRLKEQCQTTDDEPMSELKQGRYWTREQRKEHAAKAKQYRQRAKYFQQYSIIPNSDSATDDFNLLNRIFLRENRKELTEKPFLAYKYGQQSTIERNNLKRIVQQTYFNRIKSQSTTTASISSTFDQSSMIIL